MGRAHIILFLCAFLAVLDVRPINAQGCTDTVICSVPVAGNGLYSLLFDPLTQVQTEVVLESPLYDTISNFSIQAWFFLTPVNLPGLDRPILFKGSFTQTGAVVTNGNLQSAEFYLYVNGTNYVTFIMGGGGAGYGFSYSAGPVTADLWTQVTVTVNSATGVSRMYIDGSLVASQTWQLADPSLPYAGSDQIPRVPASKIQVGLFVPISGAANRFDGRIDEVRIWNRSLSNADINSYINRALVGDETGLVSYFPFNEGSGATIGSPWPLDGPGRRAPSWVSVTQGTITPGETLIWSLSEVQVDSPTVYYAQPGYTLIAADLFADFQIYAEVPSGATSTSNLGFFINDFPTSGTLYWNGFVIDENYDGDPITGNRTNPYPVMTYIPNDGFTGTDSMTYYASYRDGTSQLVTVPFATGCRWIDPCNVCEGDSNCVGCLPAQKDACGVCFGNGSSCYGCDGVPGSNAKTDDCGVCNGNNRNKDACGVCFGNNSTCSGCDGVPNSNVTVDDCGVCGGLNAEKDVCGVCFGNGTSCVGCDNIPQVDPSKRRFIDACGVCTLPENANSTCRGCDGKMAYPPKMLDQCGVCGGNNTLCLSGCDNMPNSKAIFDECGVCGGDGISCKGCDGVPHQDPELRAKLDACGVCGGNGSSCADCDGVPNGPNPPDECGICPGHVDFGAGLCLDCLGCPNGDAKLDACGVCNGDNSTCTGCDGVPEPDPKLRAHLDHCGVCNGNDSTCSGEWCDPSIPLSHYDGCGVCNGDNSTCMCTTYRNRTVAQLDCVLLEWTLANTVVAINEQLTLLDNTSDGLDQVELGSLNEYIGDQIKQLNTFATECSETYCTTLSSLVQDIYAALSSSSSTRRRRGHLHASTSSSADAISRFASLLPSSSSR